MSMENMSRGTPKFILMHLGCPVNSSRTHAWPVRMDVWWGMHGNIERTCQVQVYSDDFWVSPDEREEQEFGQRLAQARVTIWIQ